MDFAYGSMQRKPSVEEFLELFKPNEIVFKSPSLRKKLEARLKKDNWGLRICFFDMPDPKMTIVSVGKHSHVIER
jgi:hypothetical protein